MTIADLAAYAREHAQRLQNDVSLCSNREEHIRLTARANEAMHLAVELTDLSETTT